MFFEVKPGKYAISMFYILVKYPLHFVLDEIPGFPERNVRMPGIVINTSNFSGKYFV